MSRNMASMMQMNPPKKRAHATKAAASKARVQNEHTPASAAERVKLKKRRDNAGHSAPTTKARSKKFSKKDIKEPISEEDELSDDTERDWPVGDGDDEIEDDTAVGRDDGKDIVDDEVTRQSKYPPPPPTTSFSYTHPPIMSGVLTMG